MSHDARVSWPDEIDEILAGDLTVTIGMPTPKAGVVLASVTPLGLRDRDAGTVSFTTSLGFGRKLERIAADPRIAVLYHARQHGKAAGPGVVLVQGRAAIRPRLGADELEQLKVVASDHLGQVVEGRFWSWWLSVYYFDRVMVDVHAERILWWPDGDTSHAPKVLGAPLPTEPPAEHEATGDVRTPRVPMRKTVKGLAKEHRLLGVTLTDGMPLVVPIDLTGAGPGGVRLAVDCPVVPTGDRRAGLLAHTYQPGLVGIATATHTGWLRHDGPGETVWVPHTRHAFAAPPNKTLLLLGNGAAARWGYRQAIKQGRQAVLDASSATIGG